MENQLHAINSYQRYAKAAGQQLNIKKTKSLTIEGPRSHGNQGIPVEGGIIEEVDHFPYLGSEFQSNGGVDTGIKSRMNKARGAFSRRWNTVWGVREISLATKCKVNNACILPVLLYSSETWPISRPLIKKMDQQQMSWLRRITGITRMKQRTHRIKDIEIRRMCKMDDMQEMLHQRVLRWAGHVARMPNSRLPKMTLFAWWPEGIRSSKNSMARHKFRLSEALKNRGVPEVLWLQLAQNRGAWRRLVKGKHYEEVFPKPPPPKAPASMRIPAAAQPAQIMRRPASAQEARAQQQLVCQFPGCGQICKGKLGLTRHTQMKHTEGTKASEGFQCERCPYFTKSQKALTEHARNPISHTPNAFICPKCLAHFPNRPTRNKHAAESCHKPSTAQ